jgi:hypothetical protein
MFRYGSIPNIVTDVMMLILPMPLIWSLHVSPKVKIGLLVTFLLGSMSVLRLLGEYFASLTRQQGRSHIYSLIFAFFTPLVDGTWTAVPLLCWGNVEPSILSLSCMSALLEASDQVSSQGQWFDSSRSAIVV